eukprot:scaffold5412_cov171-Ochromonas_danica.AAC.4
MAARKQNNSPQDPQQSLSLTSERSTAMTTQHNKTENRKQKKAEANPRYYKEEGQSTNMDTMEPDDMVFHDA